MRASPRPSRSPRLLPALLLGSLLALAACGEAPARPAPAGLPGQAYDAEGRTNRPLKAGAPRPNVIVIVIDTLRHDCVAPFADHGCSMPFLSRLARENVWFPQASSSSSWTLPSLASMLTALAPYQHQVKAEDVGAVRLDRLTTWGEIMRATLGYQSEAFFGGLSPGVRATLGQGFDQVHDGFQLRQAPSVLEAWQRRLRPDAPFFLLLHTYEAHDPYGEANHPTREVLGSREALDALLALGENPPAAELLRRSSLDANQRYLLRTHPRLRHHQQAITRYMWSGLAEEPDATIAADLRAGYGQGVGWVDTQLEQTFQHLRQRGLLENTLWIVTSDHGEAFGEHGMLLHGRQLYDELVRVPLVMGGPAPFGQALEAAASVGLTDLLPTVLDWLGAPTLDDVEGRSFLPVLASGGEGRSVLAEVTRSPQHTAGQSVAEVVSVRSARWKYIGTLDVTKGTLLEEAYDLRSDPEERRNLAGPDGLVGALPFDAEFCVALERARDRLWAAAEQATWDTKTGYAGTGYTMTVSRPPSPCAPR